MPRNGAGTFTLAQPAFTPQTPISSAAVNSDLSDIATALTGSIAADGQTPITAALRLDSAGFVYGADPNTGVRRTGADQQAIFVGGGDVIVVTTTDVLVYGNINVSGRVLSGGGDLVPPGMISPYAGASQPTGWFICNGSAVSRTTYAVLFAVIGTAYGAGDGSTTFNVPDLRGRVPAMLDGGTGRLPGYTALNVSGGAPTVTLTTAQMPTHSHGGATANMSATGNPNHNHTYNAPSGILNGDVGATIFPVAGSASTNTSTANIDHSHLISAEGGGGSHTNVQPTIAVNYIIKW